jgi:hypothetical protein
VTNTIDHISIEDVVAQAYTISTDTTVTTYVKIPKGVTYAIASGKVLTFSGGFEAGRYQVFSGAGTVEFSSVVPKEVYPEWWGAVANDSTDCTTAINNAITSLPAGGGKILFSPGVYKTTDEIHLAHRVHLDGSFRAAEIHGVHTGDSVINMVGVTSAKVKNLEIQGDATTTPKTGILIARDGVGGGAQDIIRDNYIYGSFDLAPIYSVSGEDNRYEDNIIYLTGGTAVHCLYISRTDSLAIGGSLPEVSTFDNVITGNYITNTIDNAGATCICLDIGHATYAEIGIYVGNNYVIGTNGSYLEIKLRGLTLGGISIINLCGEGYLSDRPTYGIRISAPLGAATLGGLFVLGGYLPVDSGTEANLLSKHADVTLSYCYFNTILGRVGLNQIPSASTKLAIGLSDMPVYADNAAAKVGLMVDGECYIDATGHLMIVYT